MRGWDMRTAGRRDRAYTHAYTILNRTAAVAETELEGVTWSVIFGLLGARWGRSPAGLSIAVALSATLHL